MSLVRLAVRLSPPLVADLLARLVDETGDDVAIDLSTGVVEPDTDILVTSSALPARPPSTIVLLRDPIAPGTATILSGGATEEVEVADLAAIGSLVRTLCVDLRQQHR